MTIILSIFGVIAAVFIIDKLTNKATAKRTSISSTTKKYILVDSLIKRALEKQIVEDYKGAIAIVDKIIEIDPENFSALTCRATSLQALNFNLDAIDDFEKALRIDKTDANIYGLLGMTYIQIGEIENEMKNLEISMQMGLMIYEVNYNMIIANIDELKETMVKRAKVPENLQRRIPKDFIDNMSPVDEYEFKKEFKAQIHDLEYAIKRDPNNSELKKLYEFAKRQFE
jgi:tetratricopeptide (TPR) repeat protein